MDPELWRNPQEFQPERFLNESHSCIEKPEFFMPFGSGQRMCLGDQLAEKEFFLFFTSIMHCFDLENPSGRDLPSLRGVQGVTNSPSDFSVMCYPRNIAALKNSLIIENNFQDSTNLWSTRTCGWFLILKAKIFNSTKFSISINGHSWEDLVARYPFSESFPCSIVLNLLFWCAALPIPNYCPLWLLNNFPLNL